MDINETSVEIEKITDNFKKHENLFNELRGQVISCARKIKIFMIISEHKLKHSELLGESFWGWLQIETLCPEIMASCHKLASDIPKYISVFLKLIVPEHLIKTLKKESKLMRGVKYLKDESEKFEQFRNKRGAHIECAIVDSVTFQIKPLYESLSSIDSSLNYIAHFLLNPFLMTENNWQAYNIDKLQDLDSLDIYFDYDYSARACSDILNTLHQAPEMEKRLVKL